MDDAASPSDAAQGRSEPGGGPRTGLRRSNAPHHRRRRWTAGAGLLVAAVIVLMALIGSGVPPRAHPRIEPARLLARVGSLAGSGPASVGGEEITAQAAAINRTVAYTPYVRVAGAQHRELALTFDDGPGPYTPGILDVLERMHVPGTFFEVGVSELYFHAATKRIVADRFPIGDHTETHAALSSLPGAGQRSQLLQEASAIGQYGAPFPRIFRPPYGRWNDTTLAVLKHLRMLMVLWTIDTNDYLRPGVPAIVHAAVKRARPGAIILLHDAGGDRSQTVAALPRIIHYLRARGYKLVTVPQLLLDNPAPRNQVVAGLSSEGG